MSTRIAFDSSRSVPSLALLVALTVGVPLEAQKAIAPLPPSSGVYVDEEVLSYVPVTAGDPFLVTASLDGGFAERTWLLGHGAFQDGGVQGMFVRLPDRMRPLLSRVSVEVVSRDASMQAAHPGELEPLVFDVGDELLFLVAIDFRYEAGGTGMLAAADVADPNGYRDPIEPSKKLYASLTGMIGIGKVTPPVAVPGAEVRLDGFGFGRDDVDVCSMVVSGGQQVGWTRANAVLNAGTRMDLDVERIEPGSSTGAVMIEIGDGDDQIPPGTPPDVVITRNWTWLGVGNSPAVSPTIAVVPSSQRVCNTYTSSLTPAQLTIDIPDSDTFAPNSDLKFRGDIRTEMATLYFDDSVELQNTVQWDALTCANRVGAIVANAFFQRGVVTLFGVSQNPAAGLVQLSLNSPFDPFKSGSMYINVCP